VIGAGPAGLATAAALATRGVEIRMIDREALIGGAYARMDPTLLMTSPAALTGLPGMTAPPPRAGLYLTAAEYVAYLRDYADAHDLVPEAATVSRVRVSGPGYRVELASGEVVDAETIVVASGVFDHPYRPTFAGTPAMRVIHSAEWRRDLVKLGMRVVVVGGATSAVEIAELCARAGCTTTVAARRIAIGPQQVLGLDPTFISLPLLAYVRPHQFCRGTYTVPAGDRGFAKLRRNGSLAVRREPVRIDGTIVELADGHRCEADLVVLATGYQHAAPFLPEDLARTPRGIADTRRNESVSHRGIFVVGAPCARAAASQYLYGIARDARRVADTIKARVGDRAMRC
jgi:putative flavoprotein involved in K+ transport